jgi:Amt family ammonium transporter
VENKLKIDDPVGAISVHGVGGLFGVLSVGIFADGSYGEGWNLAEKADGTPIQVKGLIYGETGQFFAQLIGALTICIVMFGIAFAFFKIQNALTKGGIRPDEEMELSGLDIPEMGVAAYDFGGIGAFSTSSLGEGGHLDRTSAEAEPVEA